jgi:phosphatidylglycerol:prolipoprotein diacylglycerol transferase
VHPEILSLGPLHIRSFGLMLALSFLVGAALALGEARRKGIDETRLVNLILVILVTSIAGARAMYVGTHLAEFAGRPLAALALWEGGLTLYGGFAAGTLGGFLYMARAGLPPHLTADVLAPPFALGYGIARIGCFLNGCCFGLPAGAPWGVVFPAGSAPDLQFPGQALYPSQLYNSAAGIGLFLLLLWLRPRLKAPGQLWWGFVVLFSLIRIPIDQTRYYEPSAYLARWGGFGLTDSELLGFGLIVLGSVMFAWCGRRARGADGR